MWLQEVEQFSMGGGKEVVKLLVGNKIDQTKIVPRQTADEWARSHGMLFMEASAKTKEGINVVFDEVVQKILENPALLSNTRPQKSASGKANLTAANSKGASSGGCC
jgi:Ras-related protein Rab-18